jgi:hypothetical protein
MSSPSPSASSKSPKRTRYGVFAGAILVLCVVPFEYLHVTGYCYRDMRYLSDKELISVAADAAVQTNKAYAAFEKRIEYESATDLLAKNPSCCSVTRDQNDTFLQGRTPDRIFGPYVLAVEVLYRAKQDGPKPFYSDVYYLSACGERLDRAGAAQADYRLSTTGR